MSDEEWAGITYRASQRGVTASAFLRALAGGGFIIPQSIVEEVRGPYVGAVRPKAVEGRFNTQPFTPVPKKGK